MNTRSKIKNSLVISMFIGMVLVLSGCPASNTTNGGDVVGGDGGVDTQVMGSVIIEGNFLDDNKSMLSNVSGLIVDANSVDNGFREVIAPYISQANHKGGGVGEGLLIDLGEVVELFKSNITELELQFRNIDTGNWYTFQVEVINGAFQSEMFMTVGEYEVYVYAYDLNRSCLFYAYERADVSAGVGQTMHIYFNLNFNYQYHFSFSDEYPLPGEYSDFGEADTFDENGQPYYTGYYTEYEYNQFDEIESTRRIFSVWLPLDFNISDTSGTPKGTLVVTDTNGDNYAADLYFTLFDAVGTIMEIDYVESDRFVDLEVEFHFPEY